MSIPEYDAIVVGAGPAGSTAALLLARYGCKVVLVERGEYPGSKNMFGGALYGRVLHEIIPEFWNSAPVERYIGRRIVSLLTSDSSVAMDFNLEGFKKPPYNGMVVRRSSFDGWLAGEAAKAGALLLTETTVDDIIRDGSQITGIRTSLPEGEIRAKVVIAADGALSLLGRRAGLCRDFVPEHFSLGVKEILQLPPGALEERFAVSGDLGVSAEYLGGLGEGLYGGAFLYTCKDSLSIGVVVRTHTLKKTGASVYDSLERFKAHPAISPLLEGGSSLEFSAHLIPEGGIAMTPRLFTSGMLLTGDAAGLVLAGGIFMEGINNAVYSGRMAAETVIDALEKGDFSAATLSGYGERLNESNIMQDLNRFKGAGSVLLDKRIYDYYPSFICRALERWLTVDGKGHQKLAALVKTMLAEETGMLQAAVDGYRMGRAMIW